ncbi:endonuclease V [Nanobdella aerobiophila]|uniref:Endonuclease V n=1 Tax=Nanobdella aerobiophila TaxID=2586965 RepID=A0A915SK62_9ARCH|nr:endonuclease V [Nanobdella aerobiophila]BBL45458.1 endonuclease V [Nanobdella aerobiophila]
MNEILLELKNLIDQIPKGYVSTFKILSYYLGSEYAVRFILNYYRNLNTNWWRLVNEKGIIYNEEQRKLLLNENINIVGNKVDLNKYLFKDFKVKERILEKYRNIQIQLANKIVLKDIKKCNIIGGVDLSYKGDIAYVVYTIFDKDLNLLNSYIYQYNVDFPYIPSFLSFREGNPIINTFGNIKEKIDLLFVNGHGIIHPYKMGLASYIGVILNIPTIGVAKSLLYGKLISNNIYIDKELVGYKIIKFNRSIFVSPGNLITLENAKTISEKYWIRGAYPEPLRLADYISKKIK